MVISRKEMLEGEVEAHPLTVMDVSRLRVAMDKGNSFKALTEMPGWKKLMDDFITPQMSQNMYLSASREDLADVRAAQRKLGELLLFINDKIKNGQEAFEELQRRK